MLKKLFTRGLAVALIVVLVASYGLSAAAAVFVPYTTYTYDFDGNDLKSPHAYVAKECLTAADMKLDGDFSSPNDITIGPDGNVYVTDTGNNRIVLLTPDLEYVGAISNFYDRGAILPKVRELLLEENGDPSIDEKLAEEAAAGVTTTTAADANADPLAGGGSESKIKSVAETREKLTKTLNNRLKKYNEPDEDKPDKVLAVYEMSLDQYYTVEERLAATPKEEYGAEYDKIVAEFTAAGAKNLPPLDVVTDDLIKNLTPHKFGYDSITEEDMAECTLGGDTEEERRAYAYFEFNLSGSENDPSSGSLNAPEGVFISEDNTLYVADTGNARVVKLVCEGDWDAQNYKAYATFKKPESSVLKEELTFNPMNLVVDSAGRMYINLKNVNDGIMQLNANGEFMGFFGAQKVSGSVVQWFLQLFQSDEQRARTVRYVPRSYNNITIDDKNFIWLTANSMEKFDQYSYLSSGDSANAPVKRLNPSGNDVMVRNGVWAPGGDIPEDTQEVSSIVDVAVKGDTGIYTLVDEKRNKLFTYDSEGNLLYAFGGTGAQLGVFTLITSAVYQDTDLLVLDKSTGFITRFYQTEYATLIETALTADDSREYDRSEAAWKEVQKYNANFDMAYIGLAKCYLHSAAQADTAQAKELYQKAMEYYKLARNTTGYSKAFKEYRSLYVRDNLLLILAVPIVIGVLLYFAFRAVNKVNAKLHVTGSQTTLKEELCYGWRTIFHPLNGFWEIKREKRGSMRAAIIFLAGATLAFIYQATGTAYLFNNTSVENISLLQQAANVLLPVVLWVIASWCFTTLMSGEGSMKDIFIATCYALIPMILLLIPATLLSNIFSLDEEPFLTFFNSLAYLWVGILIVFGSMVVQDYTFGKNLLTVILAVLGMAAIMFIVMLLISLTGKMFGFLETIFQEIFYRM